ncbi:type II toxin-antitoxin system RelE/ParE family toxin [Methylobacterium platani]|uniref:type II toxin-antitoxin system RelE/ParE family toxin n=1 Tax=Methylobacterium platani TaxID=427683 RepID=UPI0009E54959|nr:type II toxin-antitoxin system RelE/ParE family toxin [Methylobacterium platani]
MPTIRQTLVFRAWIASLRDERARLRIDTRIRRLSLANPGDAKTVGGGGSELRIDDGPGYRIYFTQRGSEIVILLCGGDKRTQDKGILAAKHLSNQE